MKKKRILTGLGNYARNDDGIGLRIIEYIIDHNLDKDFEAIEIGNDGMKIMSFFNDETEKIVIIDCALMNKKPGEFQIFSPDDIVSKKVTGNISTHEGDILKLIAFGEKLGYPIPETTLMGIEPDSLEMDMRLSKTLESRLEEYALLAIEEINRNN